MDALAASRQRFTSRLTAGFFVRFHMGLIFAGTVGTAVIASRLLLVAGVHSLMIRYALTVVGAYAVFFVLIRAWIAYVNRTAASDPGLDLPDVAPGGGGGPGGGGEFQPGGGQFGGGGASGGYDDPGEAPVFRSVAEAGGRGGGSHGSSAGGGRGGDWLSLDLDMDEGILVVALVLLVSVVGGAAVWMVGQAPVILPEAAFEALLAAGLVKAARRSEARGWTRGVLKSTVIPFALVRRLFPAQRAAACRLRLGCGWCRDMPRPAGSSGHFRSPCYGPDGRRLQAARLRPMSDPGENSNVPSLKGLHVLVIDDDDAACYVWRSYLSRAGAIVSTATDGPSALQGLQKNPVDIVVADLALPGMTGMEVVTHWSRARLLAPPVIAIAVTGHPELRADALRAGFTAFLEKPVDPLKLVQEIARHAKR